MSAGASPAAKPMNIPPSWTPDSWCEKPVTQQAAFPDQNQLRSTLKQLSLFPPLVTSWEVEKLKSELAEAVDGKRFLLQGGNCSESFDDCHPDAITAQLKILLKMSLVLVYGLRKPVVRIGRIAGQYAKPRSSDFETRDGLTLPSYRGHLVNRPEFSEAARMPNPENFLHGYQHAAITLNFIRGLIDGGFADLRHPEFWELGFVAHASRAKEYQHIVDSMEDAISFMEAISLHHFAQLERVDFYTSHEGLQLDYEQAQTRQVPRRPGWYNLHAHFLWIGARTRNLSGAHVEYFRGISNPIGVKLDAKTKPEEVVELAEVLNPHNEPGRLTFIHRFGVQQIATCLPPLIEAIQRVSPAPRVLWCADPMHGNTHTTASGRKTRSFDAILSELEQAFDIHRKLGSVLGGVHFELTGENVTECLGGARGLDEAGLEIAYQTDVDPRLNYEQALEMAMLINRRI